MTDKATLRMDNPFWQFSLAVYADPAVAATCLDLQDRYGADVNLLLLAAWLGAARGLRLEPADLAFLPGAGFRDGVIHPLRTARRHLRGQGTADPALEALYQEVKQAEIAAERVRQAELFAWAEARWTTGSPARGWARVNLTLLLNNAPDMLLDRLAMAAEAHFPELFAAP